jgi:hypothetical protein
MLVVGSVRVDNDPLLDFDQTLTLCGETVYRGVQVLVKTCHGVITFTARELVADY